ncbi:ABC transporter ATP-binding protein [Providencia rettgeri]|uniref:ATP-binding cassette domain-containing protein n=1 Tax=Providencia sp. PROV269 TaxID=2949957 RepID=UPI0023492D20|nr:ABC transporter ATP-binding protein [Providencia sp. PROV269]ELR5296815.1 ABC transporter ATP-binding protein [Providencia rettgeri]MCL0016754.1 ABC transporter ATP-binding protein/permease [Providencia rettgeri]
MLKRLLYTVRNAIFWMTLSAVLEGISGLFLFVVILDWHLDTTMPLILFTLSSLTTLAVTFIATQKGYVAGGLVMRYLATALILHLPLSLQPISNSNQLISGPVSQAISVPAHLLHPIISGLVTPCTIVIGMLVYQGAFGAILLFILLLLLVSLRLSARKIAFFERAAHESEQQAMSALNQYALHQPLIRRSNTHYEQLHPKLALASQYQTQRQLQRRSLPFHLLFSLMVQTAFITLFGFGIYLVDHAKMPLNMWLAGLVLLARLIEPMWLLSHLDQSIRQMKKSIQRIEIALQAPVLTFPYRSSTPTIDSVSCEQLSFYSDNKKCILQNIGLSFKEHTLTAIVGPSGAGKSTLLSLLARLQDPTYGSVNYGNKNIKNLSQEVLCAHRGVLLQDSRLFCGSVRQNLVLDDDNIDDRAISALLTQLNFTANHTFLEKEVGSGGMLLSGGQRQRLCIARLILQHPNIILMDEPTASLDNINTASVIDLITQAKQQTRIVVTHQPNLARQADEIVYMEKGKIIAQGTHLELMANIPWYQQFIQQTPKI